MLDDLKNHLDKDPFVPFRIVLTSGNTYDVFSPYQISMGESILNFFFPRSDRYATIRLNQLVALETLETPKA